MVRLLDLSAELILCVASHVEQVDLLNVSLTCRRLKEVTEPELYREYSDSRLHSCTNAKFVHHLLKRPELAKHVKKLELKRWEILGHLIPDAFELFGIAEEEKRKQKIEVFDRHRGPGLTELEYNHLTEGAIRAGIIESRFPYEVKSSIIEVSRPMLSADVPAGSLWYTDVYGHGTTAQNIPYDRQFCQLLRAGIDDAYAVLLLAILPNVSSMFLRGPHTGPTALKLPYFAHGFKALRTVKIGSMDVQPVLGCDFQFWGINYLEGVLTKSPLEVLCLQNASSWCQQDADNPDRLATLRLTPRSLRLTKLEMHNCTLRASDMQALLNATASLRSLLYWTGPRNFAGSELIQMLEPFKDTLEELYLEVMPFWPLLEEQENEGRLSTLSHFTALKILDTTPEMWEAPLNEHNAYQPISQEDLLCHRLPPNLEKLIFHPPRDLETFHNGSTPDVLDRRQIEDIISSTPSYYLIFKKSSLAALSPSTVVISINIYKNIDPSSKV